MLPDRRVWALVVALLAGDALAASTGDVHVRVQGLRNDRGFVHLALYDSPAGFPASGRSAFRYVSLPIAGGAVDFTFMEVPYGKYAIGFLHDENGDEVMQTNVVGVPLEGYGASNNPPRRLGPPKFEQALFTVGSDVVEQDLRPIYWF